MPCPEGMHPTPRMHCRVRCLCQCMMGGHLPRPATTSIRAHLKAYSTCQPLVKCDAACTVFFQCRNGSLLHTQDFTPLAQDEQRSPRLRKAIKRCRASPAAFGVMYPSNCSTATSSPPDTDRRTLRLEGVGRSVGDFSSAGLFPLSTPRSDAISICMRLVPCRNTAWTGASLIEKALV